MGHGRAEAERRPNPLYRFPIPQFPGWLRGEGGGKPSSRTILQHVCRVPECRGRAFHDPRNLPRHYSEHHTAMDYWGMWKRMEARARRRAEVVNGSKGGDGKAKAGKGARQRRVCCCEGCTMENCGKCKYCKDMPRFSGENKLRQRCVERVCLGSIALDTTTTSTRTRNRSTATSTTETGLEGRVVVEVPKACSWISDLGEVSRMRRRRVEKEQDGEVGGVEDDEEGGEEYVEHDVEQDAEEDVEDVDEGDEEEERNVDTMEAAASVGGEELQVEDEEMAGDPPADQGLQLDVKQEVKVEVITVPSDSEEEEDTSLEARIYREYKEVKEMEKATKRKRKKLQALVASRDTRDIGTD